jgi:FKBP-type peptidyl-prolyl cis-trans isomerase (trigger factor)
VQALLEKMAENFPNKDEFMAYYQRQNYLMRQLESRVIEDQVLDILLSQANVEDKTLSYQEAAAFLDAKEKEKQAASAQQSSEDA